MANLQEILRDTHGSFSEAEKVARRAISKGMHEVWLDLAMIMHAQGKMEEVRKCHYEYGKFFPLCPRNRFSQGWLSFHDGDLMAGWENIEAGREIHQHPLKLNSCEWNGEDSLKGKTILLFCEGGHGDQIMMARSVNWFGELGAKVIVACAHSLMKLFGRMPGVASVVSNAISSN